MEVRGLLASIGAWLELHLGRKNMSQGQSLENETKIKELLDVILKKQAITVEGDPAYWYCVTFRLCCCQSSCANVFPRFGSLGKASNYIIDDGLATEYQEDKDWEPREE